MASTTVLADPKQTNGEELRIVPYADRHLEAVVQLLNVCLGEKPGVVRDESYWDWKHLQNPFGRSVLLLGFVGGELAGVRAFMRWRFFDGRRLISAVKPVDSATHPRFQRRGIFSQLTNEALRVAEQEGVEFCFNTPNSNSLPGYLKLGWRRVTKLPLLFRVLRPVRLASKLVKRRGQAHFAPRTPQNEPVPGGFRGSKGDGFGKPSHRRVCPGIPASQVLSDEGQLGELLDARGISPLMETERSVEFLRWRYGCHPHVQYFAETAESHGRIDGVLFYRLGCRYGLAEVMIVDVLVRGRDPGISEQLLRRLSRRVRADYLVAHAPAKSPLRTAYRRAGFHRLPRKDVQLVGREMANSNGRPLPHDARWDLCLGDDLIGF